MQLGRVGHPHGLAAGDGHEVVGDGQRGEASGGSLTVHRGHEGLLGARVGRARGGGHEHRDEQRHHDRQDRRRGATGGGAEGGDHGTSD